MEVKVLRLDHRRQRDARITTHVCLTARALGATGVFLSGDHDKKLIENVHDVAKRWGGEFRVEYHKKWENLLNEWKNNGGEIIHLTMYGEPVQTVAPKIRNHSKINWWWWVVLECPAKCIKRRMECFCDHTTHSEVSSLALFLHMLYDGKELELEFEGGDMKIIPSQKGKNVKIRDKRNDDDPKLRI
jgi:tRNA (cytidine56-2'-O)-methyltransferase